jgi:uncharacterized protein YqjF (DUF2071 family)
MRVPRVHGVIRRRILVNYRADPEVVERFLPRPFRPKLHRGHAIAGICLIRLEAIRPRRLPAVLGLASENAAHRIAVRWDDGGEEREGVYIPRRDSSSLLNHLAGGRVFPGEHHRARFDVEDDGHAIDLQMRSHDGDVRVAVRARRALALPSTSIFASVAEASAFLERGSLGFSASRDPRRLDGLTLATARWHLDPLAVEHVESSFFADARRFPPGSAALDCALVMRDVEHEWIGAPDLPRKGVSPPHPAA